MNKLLVLLIIFFNLLSNNFNNNFVYGLFSTNQKLNNKKETFNSVNIRKNESEHCSCYFNFLTSYYDNLCVNFGQNYKGSCGYVAIGMLLSYYDTFLNDSIIPEQYDVVSNNLQTDMTLRRNSPGIMRDYIFGPDGNFDEKYVNSLKAVEYYNIIENKSDYSLHAKLVTIGNLLGYYNYEVNDGSCETNFNQRIEILKKYFKDINNYNYNKEYSINFYNSNYNFGLSKEVRNFAIKEVIKGNPVLLAVTDSDIGYAVIAYDYDANSDKLFCHMGVDLLTRETIESQGYYIYTSALSIKFNLPHKHSNNYAVTSTINGGAQVNYYCYHDCRIQTYIGGNEHSYHEHFERFSQRKHKSYCVCGKYQLRPHAILEGSSYYNNGILYANCIDCNEVINLNDNFGFIVQKRNKNMRNRKSYILPNGIYVLTNNDVEKYKQNNLNEIFFDN